MLMVAMIREICSDNFHARRKVKLPLQSGWPFRSRSVSSLRYAVLSSASPSSAAVSSRITNFCTLPVTVIGKPSTKRM